MNRKRRGNCRRFQNGRKKRGEVGNGESKTGGGPYGDIGLPYAADSLGISRS